jgi:hypothetical protein
VGGHRLDERSQQVNDVLARIEATYGRHVPKRERVLRAATNARMAVIKSADPDPLGATAAERITVGPDFLAHTEEGRAKSRERRQWFAKMRRARVAVRVQVEVEWLAARSSSPSRPLGSRRSPRRTARRSSAARSPAQSARPQPARPRPSAELGLRGSA